MKFIHIITLLQIHLNCKCDKELWVFINGHWIGWRLSCDIKWPPLVTLPNNLKVIFALTGYCNVLWLTLSEDTCPRVSNLESLNVTYERHINEVTMIWVILRKRAILMNPAQF